MFVQTNYDVNACCDRIILNLAMVASQKFGVHPKATHSNALTLQTAKFYVRTDLGLSSTSFSHSPTSPIYGTGQGSGNSPMIWGFVSSVLLDAYKEKAEPAVYCHPDGSNELKLAMIGFVDDNNGQVNKFRDEQNMDSLYQLMDHAKQNATLWAELLGATGGALELQKCSYHILYWSSLSKALQC